MVAASIAGPVRADRYETTLRATDRADDLSPPCEAAGPGGFDDRVLNVAACLFTTAMRAGCAMARSASRPVERRHLAALPDDDRCGSPLLAGSFGRYKSTQLLI